MEVKPGNKYYPVFLFEFLEAIAYAFIFVS